MPFVSPSDTTTRRIGGDRDPLEDSPDVLLDGLANASSSESALPGGGRRALRDLRVRLVGEKRFGGLSARGIGMSKPPELAKAVTEAALISSSGRVSAQGCQARKRLSVKPSKTMLPSRLIALHVALFRICEGRG